MADPVEGPTAIQPRHDQVEDHQIEAAAESLDRHEGLDAIPGGRHHSLDDVVAGVELAEHLVGGDIQSAQEQLWDQFGIPAILLVLILLILLLFLVLLVLILILLISLPVCYASTSRLARTSMTEFKFSIKGRELAKSESAETR